MKKKLTAVILAFAFMSTTASASILGSQLIDNSSILFGRNTTLYNNTFVSDQSGVGLQTEYYAEYTPNSDSRPVVVTGESIWGKRTITQAIDYMESNNTVSYTHLALSSFMYADNEIISAVPIPSELKTKDVNIVLETQYPFDYRFKYTIKADKDFTFRIRIPSWAENIIVDGKKFDGNEAVFEISKTQCREIHVTYSVAPTIQKREYGLYTVQCSPLVFSLPVRYEKKMYEYEKDGVERKFPYCDYEYIPVSDWNYAYCSTDFKLEKREVGDIPFSSTNPPIVIKAHVKQIDWKFEDRCV